MAKVSEATLGKKVLCNPPVRAISKAEMAASIDSAEALIASGCLNEAEVKHLIAADEWYLAERAKCDAGWSERYKAVLETAVDRMDKGGDRE